jgi:hypothetical protein
MVLYLLVFGEAFFRDRSDIGLPDAPAIRTSVTLPAGGGGNKTNKTSASRNKLGLVPHIVFNR